MSNNPTFEAIFSVLDKMSAPLKTITAAFSPLKHEVEGVKTPLTGLDAVFHRAAVGIEEMGEKAEKGGHHWRQFVHSIGEFSEKSGVSKIGEALGDIFSPLTALGGVFSLTGLAEMGKSTAEMAEKLQLSATAIGTNVEALQELHFAAKQVNVDQELMDKSLERLNRNIGLAASGKSKDLVQMFGHLGIALKDHGHIRDAASVFGDLAEAMKRNVDPALRARIAVAAFGREGQDLIPLLVKGREGLEEYRKEAHKTGNVLSKDQVDAAAKSGEAWKALNNAMTGFQNTVGITMAPVITPIVEALTHLVEEIGQAHLVVPVLGIAVAALGVTFLGIISPVISATGVLLRFLVVGPLMAFTSAIGDVLIGLRAGMGVFETLSAVFAANPFGLAIIAAVALGAAVYEIYKHWDKIVPYFKAVWAAITGYFKEAWNDIQPILQPIETAFDHLQALLNGGGGIPGQTPVLPASSRVYGGKGGTMVHLTINNSHSGGAITSSVSAPSDVRVVQRGGHAFGGAMPVDAH